MTADPRACCDLPSRPKTHNIPRPRPIRARRRVAQQQGNCVAPIPSTATASLDFQEAKSRLPSSRTADRSQSNVGPRSRQPQAHFPTMPSDLPNRAQMLFPANHTEATWRWMPSGQSSSCSPQLERVRRSTCLDRVGAQSHGQGGREAGRRQKATGDHLSYFPPGRERFILIAGTKPIPILWWQAASHWIACRTSIHPSPQDETRPRRLQCCVPGSRPG